MDQWMAVDALWTVLSRLPPPSHNPTSFAGLDSRKLPKVKSFFIVGSHMTSAIPDNLQKDPAVPLDFDTSSCSV